MSLWAKVVLGVQTPTSLRVNSLQVSPSGGLIAEHRRQVAQDRALHYLLGKRTEDPLN